MKIDRRAVSSSDLSALSMCSGDIYHGYNIAFRYNARRASWIIMKPKVDLQNIHDYSGRTFA